MNISITQIIIEVDDQLCAVKIPKVMEPILLQFLKGDDGKIAVVKLSDQWKKVALKDAI